MEYVRYIATFDILTALLICIIVLWNIILCRLALVCGVSEDCGPSIFNKAYSLSST